MTTTNEQMREALILKAARALADKQAESCNVNKEDNWNLYSEDFIADARIVLAVALRESAPTPQELTDDRICELYRDSFNAMVGRLREAPKFVPPAVLAFARSIEQELLSRSTAPQEAAPVAQQEQAPQPMTDEEPAFREDLNRLINRVSNTSFACGAHDATANPIPYLELTTKAGRARRELEQFVLNRWLSRHPAQPVSAPCANCDGAGGFDGETIVYATSGPEQVGSERCDVCNGTGKEPIECKVCSGTRRIESTCGGVFECYACRDDGSCRSCLNGKCTTGPECVTLGWDAAPVAIDDLKKRIAELEAARMAYASEFEPNADGEPDVGRIHANIRKLKQQNAELVKDAERYRWLRDKAAGQFEHPIVVSQHHVVGKGMRYMGPAIDRELDRLVDAAIASAHQENGNA